MSKQVANILIKARKHLIKNGWCQHNLYKGNKCCAYGAINKVTKNYKSNIKAIESLDQIAEKMGYLWASDFNDTFGRTKQQVLGLFTRAINQELKTKSK